MDSVASGAACGSTDRPVRRRAKAAAPPVPGPCGRRSFVLDTSVLLADPYAIGKFAEHEVVIPLVVITELEGKRNHPELGWIARRALRTLEQLRLAHGSLTAPLPANESGGTVRVEINHVSTAALPSAFQSDVNDHRILAVANHLHADGHDVVVVSKDLPLRLKASIVGLGAEEYRNELVLDSGWTGTVEVEAPVALVDRLHADRQIPLSHLQADVPGIDVPMNAGLVLSTGSASALARLHSDKTVRLVRGDQEIFGVRGRSAEQRIAIDLLLDPEVGIVSLGGPAGTGKSVLAIAAGLEAVLERETHKRVVVYRPLYAVGGQELGYLPGSESEKMSPWAGAVQDALEAFCTPNVLDEIEARGLLEVLPLTHIRGRTLVDTWVIVDEAQNLERNVLLTALSRLGKGSRAVLTHDVAQRDNLRVGRHDGIVGVVEALRGHPLFGHVALHRAERSPIAALVTDLLDAGL
jgi:PhoH-like ATPase